VISRYWPMSGHTHGRRHPLVRIGTSAAFAVSLTFAGLAAAGPAVAAGPPANDNFAAATVLTGPNGTISGDNTNATWQTGEPSVVQDGGFDASVWYSWTAPATATTTIDTCATPNDGPPAMDTVLGVFTGSAVDALTTVATSDDDCDNTNLSTVTFAAVAGTTYPILVAGYHQTQGPFLLRWSQLPSTSDLGMDGWNFPNPVAVGADLTWYFVVFNNGPDDAPSGVLTAPLPRSVIFVSATPDQGTCAMSARTVTCDLGTLTGDAEPQVAIVVRPTRATDALVNEATVTSDAIDPDPTDNSAQITTTVIANDAGCTILGTSGPDDIRGTAGADVICGLGGDDTLRGGPGDDTVYGNGGDDTLVGGRGSDTLDGAKGNDAVSYRGDPGSVNVDLAGDTATDGFGDTDTLTSVGGGGVYGSDFADVLRGSDRVNRLFGGPGDDVLSGLGGNDQLKGAAGDDTLHGGAGTDTCSGEVETGCERS
jgi:uncharacterized repeat protein (TIGR01451 family)